MLTRFIWIVTLFTSFDTFLLILFHSNRYCEMCATKNKLINYSSSSIHDAICWHNKCIAHFIRFQLTPFNVHFHFESVRHIKNVCVANVYLQFAKIHLMLFKMVNLRGIFLFPIGYDDYSCQSLGFKKFPILISSRQTINVFNWL